MKWGGYSHSQKWIVRGEQATKPVRGHMLNFLGRNAKKKKIIFFVRVRVHTAIPSKRVEMWKNLSLRTYY